MASEAGEEEVVEEAKLGDFFFQLQLRKLNYLNSLPRKLYNMYVCSSAC